MTQNRAREAKNEQKRTKFNDFYIPKKHQRFFSTSPLMFNVPQAHNSHRKLFINGLKTKIGENLSSGGLHTCVVVFAGSTVLCIHVHTYMYVCMYAYICMYVVHVCTCQWSVFKDEGLRIYANSQKKSSKHSPGIQVKKRAHLDLSTASTRSRYASRQVCAMSS